MEDERVHVEMVKCMRVFLSQGPSRLWEDGSRFLGVKLSDSGWFELFDHLGALGSGDSNVADEKVEDRDDRRRRTFRERLTAYPFLARIDDYYQHVFYRPDEIQSLFQECLIAVNKNHVSSEELGFLNGFIYACREARRKSTGIFLAAD